MPIYYDGINVKDLKYNNTEITKCIFNGVQVYSKTPYTLYSWTKWNTVTTPQYTNVPTWSSRSIGEWFSGSYDQYEGQTIQAYVPSAWGYGGSYQQVPITYSTSISQDPTTGKYSYTGTTYTDIDYSQSKISDGYYYQIYNVDGGTANGYWYGYRYFYYNNNNPSGNVMNGACYQAYQTITQTQTGTTYSKGSTNYGTVTSRTSNAYPNGARHSDGYWYVSSGSSTQYDYT